MSGIKDLLSVAGGAVGTAIGGPVGGTIGTTLGGLAGEAISSSSSSGGKPKPSGDPWGASPPTNQNWPGGLSTNARDCVDTGRYLIQFKDGEATVFDKESGTSFRAWGDPHLHTSDGDRAQFHENLSLDLPDGTKLTFQTTQKDANGIALIDAVAIMKGSQAVVVEGLTGNDGFTIGNVLNNADAVDAQFEDGTVLRAGQQVDDLTFAADGSEIIGDDPTKPFSEIALDGKGGESINRPEGGGKAGGAGGVGGTGGSGQVDDDFQITPGMSVQQILMALANKLEKTLRSVTEKYSNMLDKFNEQQQKLAEDPKWKPEGGDAGFVKEGDLKKLEGMVQQLGNMIKQIFEMASNVQKLHDGANERIISNIS